MKNYKKILIIWIAIGILIGGYLILDPIKRDITEVADFGNGAKETTITYNVEGNDGKKVLLITFVGAILIGGLGYLKNN